MDHIDDLIAREGDYVKHPAVRGGPTRWAITEAAARRHGYHDKMIQLPRTEAATIYKRIYWDAPGFADVAAIASNLAAELFDAGVNMGTGTATGFCNAR